MDSPIQMRSSAVSRLGSDHMLLDQNLHNIFMQAPLAMTILRGPEFLVELANEKALALWDRKMEDVANKEIFDAIPELKDRGWEEIFRRVYTTGEKYISKETPFLQKRNDQAQPAYVNFVFEAMRDAEGKITAIMGIGLSSFDHLQANKGTENIDVYEGHPLNAELERLIEKRNIELINKNILLKESEERYHRMVDEIQDYAVLLISRDGIILNWNKGAEKINGYESDEIIGKHFRIFYQKEEQDEKLPELILDNATKFGRAVYEGWRIRKNGSKFWGSVTLSAIHDNFQNITGFTKITRDLTDIKIANDDLKAFARKLELKNIELERMNSELDQFAYVASHDLQEPLRKIRTYSGILAENLETQPISRSIQMLNKVLTASERMSNLIYDLLNFSRLVYPSSAFEPTDLNKVLRGIIDDFDVTIEQKQAQISIDSLPTVNAIPLQMSQLFQNLLNNSLKFSNSNISPVIRLRATELSAAEITRLKDLKPGRRYVDITITDNGIGFDQQYAEQIFEAFKRLENKSIYPGSGIGLALCRKIILNHEGKIYAEGKENEGATFHVVLPLE